MSKQFIIILVALFAIFGGIIVFAKRGDNKSVIDTSAGSQNVFSNVDSKVEVVEYGDFQCPACRAYYPIIKQVESQYGDRVKIRFRHLPLTNIHPNAMAAHRAAQGAAAQGAFWQMHDILYERQDQWSAANNPEKFFEDYAKEIGLDLELFKTDSASPETAAIINSDIAIAKEFGFTGTPSFSLNGKEIERPTDFAGFAKLLDDALAQNQSQIPMGDTVPVAE
ncbi:MAG: DsbA family protein [bacterium]|nr:DsbA family protein [bacterium]